MEQSFSFHFYFDFQKCLQATSEDTVWEVKQKLLRMLAKVKYSKFHFVLAFCLLKILRGAGFCINYSEGGGKGYCITNCLIFFESNFLVA